MMNKSINYLQEKWENGFLPGIDCIVFGDGKIIIANTYKTIDYNTGKSKQYWFPLCDTTIDSLEKYADDIWTKVDIFNSSITHGNEKIVFGDGSMGNEGFVASTDKDNQLKWAIFFTFSNPILKVEIINNELICTSELDTKISINLNNLTLISITEAS
ncbi:hypothetical protein [Flavobacterium hibisci]|uniref:hypothetical protein n=1 Tax=Flavobacterium hibisci TaxID=1914462 RepID=UPI001CBBECA3|nr:hypothetical protein [Flavobacterium hibisci]MBZ4043807.1 hypothetical protein [Flavobacterium hibisci]